MENEIAIVRQDVESYSHLELLFEGCAEQLLPKFVGDIVLKFPATEHRAECKVEFDWVSSVLFGDELLWSSKSYPYFKDVDRKNGIFRVHGSSYLERIGVYFPDHFHYIYFDRDFNWHITARGIDVILP